MIIYDFFSGTGSSTQAFKDAGHTVISFELELEFQATENIDVLLLKADELIAKYGRPDFVWASPPCTAFSVAAISHHWISGGNYPVPRTKEATQAQDLVRHTVSLIQELNPIQGWLIENPRGMLRKLEVVSHLPRRTVTYCQYGDTRMKPTDLWGYLPQWSPRIACKNGMPCHVSAPRGAKTGTQGLKSARERSKVPYELGKEILNALPL
jgi:hypothetical protein